MDISSRIAEFFSAVNDFRNQTSGAGPALLRDLRETTAIEYALIASLISIAIIGALTFFAGGASDMFNNVSNMLQSNI